jgi:mono/diheme cytochrome c family protein
MQFRKHVRVLASLAPVAAIIVPALMLGANNLRPSSTMAAESRSAKVEQGEDIFKQKCVGCHNKQPGDTTPFGPPNLNGIFKGPTPVSTKKAEDIITNGTTTMPEFGKILSKNDVDDVIAYLKTY